MTDPVEEKELNGWFIYDWANGPYFYSAISFLPLVITSQAKQMAKQHFCGDCTLNEWALDYETKGSCDDSSFDSNSTCVLNGHDWDAELKDAAKNVNFLGLQIGYASFAQYCTVVSVILQLILYVTMGSLADYGENRKRLLILNTYIGVIATWSTLFTGSDDLFWLNGLVFIISVIGFNFAVVFYNAYLVILVEASPDVLEAKATDQPNEQVVAITRQLTHVISVKGLATGFAGQLVFLLINLAILSEITNENQLNLRLSIALAGVWVFIFSIITFMRLKTRPGPDLPRGNSYCRHSLIGARNTLRSFKHLTELGKYLIAYFIFSDGTSTVAGAAIIFGQEELNMNTLQIGIALIEVTICGIVGSFFFRWLNEKCRIHSKTILLLNLFMMGLIPIYGLFAMTTVVEFYIAAGVFGFNTSSQQAFTRSIFAHYIPAGRESEYFSFYEISDKGTAWLGPLVLGLVFQATGSYRQAFGTLVGFFVVGIEHGIHSYPFIRLLLL